MKCYVHPDADAVGTCSNCGKFVCTSCAVDYMGKVTCKTCVEKMAAAPAGAGAPAASPNGGAVTSAAPSPGPARKEPLLSVILSFFIPGLGQVFNGQVKKGLILIVAYIALWVIMFVVYFAGALVTMGVGALCCIPVFIVPLIVWVYAMYDAYKVANAINRGEPARDWLS